LTLLVGRHRGRKGIRPVQTEWWGAGVVICLERGADLHMAQLMPLPLTVSCFSKIQIGFTFLVPADLGSPGKGPLNGCVCVCVCEHENCLSNYWSGTRRGSAGPVPTPMVDAAGCRAFPAAAAKVWNGLPSDVTSALSLSVFKNWLKTYLFRRCYETV